MRPSILLFLLALGLRVGAALYWRFDGLYGQDAFAYLQQGLAIAENVPQGKLPPTDFFWPNGYPLLIAALTPVFGKTALAGQVVSMVSGALLAPLAYHLSRDLWPRDSDSPGQPAGHQIGLLSGLIVSVAGQPWLSSVVIMADSLALLCAGLAVWGILRATAPAATARQAGGWFLLAGACFALAIISRWLYVLLAPALIGYTLFRLVRDQPDLWWPPVLAGISGGVILLPQIWLSQQTPNGLSHAWLQGWQPINFGLRHFVNIDGTYTYLLPNGLFYAQPAGHPAYIFPLLGVASLWGLWRLWQTQQGANLILLVGWVAPGYLFLSGIPYQNFRFGLTHYLPLVLLTGYGLVEIRDRLARSLNPGNFTRGLFNGIVGLSLIGMLAWAYPMLNNFLTTHNQSKSLVRQIEQELPPEATLIAFGLTLTLQHYTDLNTLEMFYLDQAALAHLITARQPLYLLVDPDNIATQWQGQPLARNFAWLAHHTELVPIGDYSTFRLYRISANGKID